MLVDLGEHPEKTQAEGQAHQHGADAHEQARPGVALLVHAAPSREMQLEQDREQEDRNGPDDQGVHAASPCGFARRRAAREGAEHQLLENCESGAANFAGAVALHDEALHRAHQEIDPGIELGDLLGGLREKLTRDTHEHSAVALHHGGQGALEIGIGTGRGVELEGDGQAGAREKAPEQFERSIDRGNSSGQTREAILISATRADRTGARSPPITARLCSRNA